MHGYGGGRVITALFSYPCKISSSALLTMLPMILKRQIEKEVYDIYLAECLRIIGENTAKISQGSYMNKSYFDIINQKTVDNRTGEEIAAEIIEKAGLTVIE